MAKRQIVKKRRYTSKRTTMPSAAQLRNVVQQLPPSIRSLNGRGIGFPHKLRLRMKYGQSFTFGSIVAGTPEYNLFRMNSIFDPDLTGIGHQPRYYDQIAELFNYYYVEKATIKATFHSTTDQGANVAFIIPDASTASAAIPSTMSDVIEFPSAKYKHMAAENAGNAPTVLTHTVTMKKWQEDDRTSRVNIGVNPTDGLYAVVGAFNFGGANSGMWMVVEITYDVVVSELKEPGES